MAVTVVIMRDGYGEPATTDQIADGTDYTIDDGGNLQIYKHVPVGENGNVAAYAPGMWISVYIGETVTTS